MTRDESGGLGDLEGHLCNAAGRRIDDHQGAEIPYPEAEALQAAALEAENAAANAEAARPRTLADYNRPDQFYANRSAVRPPAFQRHNFDVKPSYFTLVGSHMDSHMSTQWITWSDARI